MVKPLEFINSMRNSDDYIEIIYTRGGCYQFAKILKLLYPNANLYKVKTSRYEEGYSHVITEIDLKFYDITGEVLLKQFWGQELVNDDDLEMLESWGFAKKAWLSRTCPHCDEDVIYEVS